MASKQATNLEKTDDSFDWTDYMDNNSSNDLNVTVFANAKYTRFTHIFKIPFKELEEPIQAHMSIYEVLNTFSDVIVEALNARMESCMDMLSRNLFNVVESNEHHVLFRKENGVYHSFNHISFRNMQEAVGLIKNEKAKDLGKKHYDQIIKALYWIEKPAPRNGISFGNLVSMCMDVMHIDY